jgi:hypothetical protein
LEMDFSTREINSLRASSKRREPREVIDTLKKPPGVTLGA